MADVFELVQEFFNFDDAVDVDMEDVQDPSDPTLGSDILVTPSNLGVSSVGGQHSSVDEISEEIVTPALSRLFPKEHVPTHTISAAQKKPR